LAQETNEEAVVRSFATLSLFDGKAEEAMNFYVSLFKNGD
jgi:predicted 3-demethylubiquinone-9 3-methyltransferase (glyoxalase superfamily)